MTAPARHTDTVHAQFDPQARAYLNSAVHATGPDLIRAAELVSGAIPKEKGVVLDLGCGAGHLSYALAPHVARVIAADPSREMLETVRLTAGERGLSIEPLQTAAGELPLDSGTICVTASRYSAHHWGSIARGLGDMRRVVKPGGYLLMIDVVGDEDDLVDTHLQAMELLRDKSHVRNLKASQWRQAIAKAGFDLLEERQWPLPLDFDAWVTRMRTPPERVAAIRTLMNDAPAEVREALAVTDDGSFTLKTGLFWAKAA